MEPPKRKAEEAELVKDGEGEVAEGEVAEEAELGKDSEGEVVAVAVMKPPKRARTSYLVFCDRHRADIMKEVQQEKHRVAKVEWEAKQVLEAEQTPAMERSLAPETEQTLATEPSLAPEEDSKFSRGDMQAVTTKLAALWKLVAAEELEECKVEAARLKVDYDVQKAAFGPETMKRSKKGKGAKRQILVAASGEKPKRARTAYLIFCDRNREQVMREVHSDPTSKFKREEMQAVTTRLAELWTNVVPQELAECKLAAVLCKEEFQKQKDVYVPPVYQPVTKGKKSKGGRREGDKPKRPRTAYLLFAEDCRRGLKKADPALSFTATSQMVSKEWKELAEAKKVQYQRTAEKEQEKHRVAKAQWEAKQVLEGEQALAMERSLALEGSLALGGLLAVDGSLEGAGSLVVEGEGSLEGEGAEEVPVGEDVVPDQGGVLTSLEVAVA
eukprot:CAMPEP_0198706090 /NCGR_PEP_ID=MMETSP1468-20131203/390783_1 /TAXON_ID=1461545 /ORGANISM="Mantoniella sp, Strain CCMP1436" /LENGTH=441 /DNA_ID=CAMNT_0044465013 /DNA_START=1270 /DNA_END=2595 /DNA_ORIENTATION=-